MPDTPTPTAVQARRLDLPADDVVAWFTQQALDLGLPYLLAHAYDGVIWGRFADGELRTAHEAARDADHADALAVSPPLRATTLQQAWAFGPAGELFLWATSDGWRARLLTPADPSDAAAWPLLRTEKRLLHGDRAIPIDDTFTLWQKEHGLRHAVPRPHADGQSHPPRLVVHHYVTPPPAPGTPPAEAAARIAASRLVDLA